VPISLASIARISVALSVLGPSVGWAHDNWISRQRFHDPASRSWCCDEHDCFPLDDREVEVTSEGFRLNGQYFISRKRVLPSNDTKYWVCFNEEGKGPHDREKNVRCFFAPMNM
jgi:hypothetical protein